MIRWPAGMSPLCTAVHATNELEMAAPPEIVWAWLVRAELWPEWYDNSKDVRIEGGAKDLAAESRFRWKTFKLAIESKVMEWEPYERIAWSARGVGLTAHHAWLIERTAGGCHVRTDETQNGWLARLHNALQPKDMRRGHQMWLEALHRKAKSGLPPP